MGFNKVFGYYIEVTKANLTLVPDHYIRKQTLVSSERYITEELKDLENQILSAGERASALEQVLFEALRSAVIDRLIDIQNTAQAIAQLDVYLSFAQVAIESGYCRPELTSGDELIITEGRHPVVEALLKDEPFVPNDTELGVPGKRIAIITGPNMAGKSTYIRQTALIVLLAQIGSFVPAKSARIGLVDGIYTRVGASDDLATGQSTFMVEMREVSAILRGATAQSLLILDEVGRGTSTFDGMSIARAMVEYIADPKKLGAKTLFATHYHELTELEQSHEGVVNLSTAVVPGTISPFAAHYSRRCRRQLWHRGIQATASPSGLSPAPRPYSSVRGRVPVSPPQRKAAAIRRARPANLRLHAAARAYRRAGQGRPQHPHAYRGTQSCI